MIRKMIHLFPGNDSSFPEKWIIYFWEMNHLFWTMIYVFVGKWMIRLWEMSNLYWMMFNSFLGNESFILGNRLPAATSRSERRGMNRSNESDKWIIYFGKWIIHSWENESLFLGKWIIYPGELNYLSLGNELLSMGNGSLL